MAMVSEKTKKKLYNSSKSTIFNEYKLISESREINSRVVGGFEPTPHEFPFLISVIWEFPPLIPERHICGGVIVSPDWVVTAASCVSKTGKLSVKAGKHNLDVYEPGEELREVQMSVIHKDYKKYEIKIIF